jgi:hypothetical protein
MIISLVGKKGSGKTTVAQYFLDKGFELRSFAAPLKQLLSEVFELPMFLLTDAEAKERHALAIDVTEIEITKLLDLASSKFYPITEDQRALALKNTPNYRLTTPRQLLQVVGTDIFRNGVGIDYWLNVLKRSIDPSKDYVIDDTRFANELATVKSLGGYNVGLIRSSQAADGHSSEQIDLTPCDFIIQNKYNIQTLKSDIDITYSLIKELSWPNQKNEAKSKRSEALSGTLNPRIAILKKS